MPVIPRPNILDEVRISQPCCSMNLNYLPIGDGRISYCIYSRMAFSAKWNLSSSFKTSIALVKRGSCGMDTLEFSNKRGISMDENAGKLVYIPNSHFYSCCLLVFCCLSGSSSLSMTLLMLMMDSGVLVRWIWSHAYGESGAVGPHAARHRSMWRRPPVLWPLLRRWPLILPQMVHVSSSPRRLSRCEPTWGYGSWGSMKSYTPSYIRCLSSGGNESCFQMMRVCILWDSRHCFLWTTDSVC